MGSRCPRKYRTWQCFFIGLTLILILIAILIPIIHFTSKQRNTDHTGWKPECLHRKIHDFLVPAVDCYPEPGATERNCKLRGCCWLILSKKIPSTISYPKCVYPTNYGYVVTGNETSFANGKVINLHRINTPTRYGDDIRKIAARIEEQTPYRLRVKFYDPNEERFEIPDSVLPLKWRNVVKDPYNNTLYAVSYNKSEIPFSLKVRRTNNDGSDGVTIFDTSLGGFTFSNQYIQLTTKVPYKSHIYGLGGLSRPLKDELSSYEYFLRHSIKSWQTWTLFSSGNAKLKDGHNSHGAHPMYLCVERDGNAYGLLLLNSYPMDVQYQPSPALTFNIIGGIIDIYLLLGPTPDDVMQQYTEIVGRPFMPPYWALGLHLHLPNKKSDKAISGINFMNRHNLTFDSVVLDADSIFLSDNNDSISYRKDLLSKLHERRQRIILSVQPGIEIDDKDLTKERKDKGFVKDYTAQQLLETQINSKTLIMPDFGNSVAARLWHHKLKQLGTKLPFSGLKLVQNEPYTTISGAKNGCHDDYYNKPPYIPRVVGGSLNNNTICMDSVHTWGNKQYRHLEVHNIYGHSMLATTARVLTSFKEKTRFLLLSRSTFAGSGFHGGHWFSRQIALNNWPDLKLSFISMLEYNLLGIPYVGESVCESKEKLNKNLCLRWIQLGMFYPFVQFPFPIDKPEFALHGDVIVRITRQGLETRYSLLPYLYTLFYEAHVKGTPVVRPLFYEFPKDGKLSTNQYYEERAFMWGPALLVTPYMNWAEDGNFASYFPKGLWYDFYKGLKISSIGIQKDLDNSIEKINLHIRGGYIIPMQTSWNNTHISREKPLHLLVALDENKRAKGSLYWDDGESRDGEFIITSFEVVNNTLSIIGNKKNKEEKQQKFVAVEFKSVDIIGLEKLPNYVTIGKTEDLLVDEQVKWENEILKLKEIRLPITDEIIIKWH